MGCAKCGKSMSKGGTKKMKVGGTNKVNISKPGAGYAKAQKGGDNPSKFIYGIPTTTTANAGIATMKKGGAYKSLKKKKYGGEGEPEGSATSTTSTTTTPAPTKPMTKADFKAAKTNAKQQAKLSKIGQEKDIAGKAVRAGEAAAGIIGAVTAAKNLFSKNPSEKNGGNIKRAKFGSSVPVRHSPPVAMRHKDSREGYESVAKAKVGGSLKPVPTDKKGLSKLPTEVRNKMGYQKSGGTMKKAKGGPIIDKLKAKLAERKVTKAIKKSVKSSGKIIK